MPLMNSQGNGNIFELPASPTSSKSGDLWYDTTNNRENLNIAGTMRIIIPSSLTTGDMLYFDGTNFVRLPVGTSQQTLFGGTVPAWGSAVNYSELVTVTNGANALTLASGTFTAKKNLMIIIKSSGFDIADVPTIQFNGDTGANYRYTDLDNLTLNGLNLNQNSILVHDLTASTFDYHSIIWISNISGTKKIVNTKSTIYDIGTSEGGSAYQTSAGQITSVTLRPANGAHNLLAGTVMTILGFDD